MRGIKFRAWFKPSKHFPYKMKYFTFKDIFQDNELYEAYFIDGYSIDWDKDIIMQYTGLKDKNGKEIYEGDILQHKTWFIDFLGDAKIESLRKGNVFYNADRATYAVSYMSLSGFLEGHTGEVIGNIYENPELLNRGEKDEEM